MGKNRDYGFNNLRGWSYNGECGGRRGKKDAEKGREMANVRKVRE
jgi:hypothetical protein